MRCAVIWTLVFGASTAYAHSNGVISNALFSSPAAPVITPADMGVAPFTFASADGSFPIAWEDGDTDPTGHFTFYYMDHNPSFQVLYTDIETIAQPVKELGSADAGPVAIYAGCTCIPDGDAGLSCPDLGASRDCRNGFTWDTSGVAAGTWWVVAVNNDPPYHVYAVSGAPVRVQHGGAQLPPAALVLRPDGIGSFDKSYRVQWLATGKAPLKIDLSYGLDEPGLVLGPTMSLAKNVMAPIEPDGTQVFDWDLTGVATLKVYFVRVRVTDGDGVSSYTDSRFGLSVYHPPPPGSDLSTGWPADLAMTTPPKGGCEVGQGSPATPLVLALLSALGLVIAVRRRA
jgi:hypothetical protein